MPDNNADEGPSSSRILVFSQSIGRGVPPEAQQKFEEIQELLTEKGLEPEISPWGLEGEQRLCVIVSNAQRIELMPEISKMAEGVKLLKIQAGDGDPADCQR
jgi:hypothetical protein